MHRAVLQAKGVEGMYLPVQVTGSDLHSAVRGLAVLGFRGANVTIPHKEHVLSMLDGVSGDARALGAVNTLVIEQERAEQPRVFGHNTDHLGFRFALERAGFHVRGTRAIVVGAGGAARAAVFGLVRGGASEVVIMARRSEQAEQIIRDLETPATCLRQCEFDPNRLTQEAGDSALLVHATPIGMWPRIHESIWPEPRPIPSNLTVFDLVYTPLATKLTVLAQASGASTVSGLEMLIYQGAHSFRLWTGSEAPIEAMRTAARSALEERT
jgi:shikimate dehydrogenase